MHNGYIKLWRKMEESPIFTNSEAVHLFIYLLIKASRKERATTNGTTVINLLPGQLITGRKKLSEATGINESKVYRLIELLKSEQQIEQQTNRKYSIITILNWSTYQDSEQQSEQQMNNKRTADEQQVNTIQERKKVKNEEKESKPLSGDIPYQSILDSMNQILSTKFRLTEDFKKVVKARWKDKFREEDFAEVCRKQLSVWGSDPKMKPYLRPSTIFGSKMNEYIGLVVISDRPNYSPEELAERKRKFWAGEE